MDWLVEHKEWLFSGIAITLPLAIVGWLVSSRKNKQNQKGGDSSTNIQVGGDSLFVKVVVVFIYTATFKSPPSFSGFSQTCSGRFQFLTSRDQRFGFAALAAS
jgi:hypothetical protein